jgi:hypothetical protein
MSLKTVLFGGQLGGSDLRLGDYRRSQSLPIVASPQRWVRKAMKFLIPRRSRL